jgi:membrane protein required for colicin V production
MNVLDIILIVPLLFAVYRGFKKGLIYMVASLLALILGIFGAIRFRPLIGQMLDSWFNISPDHLNVIAFAVAFILIVIIVHTAAFFADKLIKAVALSFVNRLLGVLFGLIITTFILSMLLWPINTVNVEREIVKKERIEGSLLWRPISGFAPTIFPYLKREEFKGWMPGKKDSKDDKDSIKEKLKNKKEEILQVAEISVGNQINFDSFERS